jgi:receptor protein-tyrosine kinase
MRDMGDLNDMSDSSERAALMRSGITPADRLATPDESLIIVQDSGDPRCDRIRALRTELLLRRESPDRSEVMALLSPCAGEGRSLLAAELAIAFAQTGRPTLLVDADLRQPRQHLLFNTRDRDGLTHALQVGAQPILNKVVGLPQMSLLTAGAVPGNPLELLSSRRFTALVAAWRENFEFVIIDTAPAVRYSDGLTVAGVAGRVLALSRAQHTPYKDMQDMLRRVAAARSTILGAVISHF